MICSYIASVAQGEPVVTRMRGRFKFVVYIECDSKANHRQSLLKFHQNLVRFYAVTLRHIDGSDFAGEWGDDVGFHLHDFKH